MRNYKKETFFINSFIVLIKYRFGSFYFVVYLYGLFIFSNLNVVVFPAPKLQIIKNVIPFIYNNSTDLDQAFRSPENELLCEIEFLQINENLFVAMLFFKMILCGIETQNP